MERQHGEFISIVSGLPRSGTSLMMKMLKAGGMEIITDGIRKADHDNPAGYFEYEAVKRIKDDQSWIPAANGKALKMVSSLLVYLPEKFNYKILFMIRNLDEVIASQNKMLDRAGIQRKTEDARLRDIYQKHLGQIEHYLDERNDVQTQYIRYHDFFSFPEQTIEKISEFLGSELQSDKMRSVIDPKLYRNRVN